MRRPHANARTTAEIRNAIRESPESLRVLADRYDINPKTVAKWKKRGSAEDLPPGPKRGRQRSMSAEEEQIIVRFREHTLLPLDDCLYVLQARIPHLSRASLHRCFQRHGISRLAEREEAPDAVGLADPVPVGCLQIDAASVQSTEGGHCLFIATDEASKFAFVQLARDASFANAAAFLSGLIATVPFRIIRVLTLDAKPFATCDHTSPFARLCAERGIEHQFTARPHTWTRTRATRMVRIFENGVTFADETYLSCLLRDFVRAYNYRRRLKTLRGHTPFDFVCQAWEKEPSRFLRDPHHGIMGLENMPGCETSGI